jgi:creatinine amidohydrolase
LYKAGQGYPLFDEAKAKTYFTRVNEKVAALIAETIKKWDLAGL